MPRRKPTTDKEREEYRAADREYYHKSAAVKRKQKRAEEREKKRIADAKEIEKKRIAEQQREQKKREDARLRKAAQRKRQLMAETRPDKEEDELKDQIVDHSANSLLTSSLSSGSPLLASNPRVSNYLIDVSNNPSKESRSREYRLPRSPLNDGKPWTFRRPNRWSFDVTESTPNEDLDSKPPANPMEVENEAEDMENKSAFANVAVEPMLVSSSSAAAAPVSECTVCIIKMYGNVVVGGCLPPDTFDKSIKARSLKKYLLFETING